MNDNNNDNKILIVDDEPDVILPFKLGLEDNGFKVDTFTDPLIALSTFKENSSCYALALIDIKMPKINGFELYKKMIKINDKIKVCFITAFDIQKEDRNTTISSPSSLLSADKKPVTFIRKPITIEEMVQIIRNQFH
jgi:two-component system, OmpR family, response regulator ChvI